MKIKNVVLYTLCCLIIGFFETGCRAKSCPSYLDDAPKKSSVLKLKKKNKAKGGLFAKKQRRY